MTRDGARANFAAVRAVALAAGRRTAVEEPGRLLELRTVASVLREGDRVAVRFRDQAVLVASICDLSVGHSLVSSRRCAAHRELVARALRKPSPPSS